MHATAGARKTFCSAHLLCADAGHFRLSLCGVGSTLSPAYKLFRRACCSQAAHGKRSKRMRAGARGFLTFALSAIASLNAFAGNINDSQMPLLVTALTPDPQIAEHAAK